MCALPGFCWRILPRAISRGSLVTVQSIKTSDGRDFLVNSSVLWKKHLRAWTFSVRHQLKLKETLKKKRKLYLQDNIYKTICHRIFFLYKSGKESLNYTNLPLAIIFLMYRIKSRLITTDFDSSKFRERFDWGQRPDQLVAFDIIDCFLSYVGKRKVSVLFELSH